MPEMKLAALTQSVAQLPASVNGLMATGLSLDSRTIESGGVFVAMQGLASDGRAYIDAALLAVQLRFWLRQRVWSHLIHGSYPFRG